MTINVKVKLLGIFRELYGKDQVIIELEEPTVVRRAIQKLIEGFSDEFKRAIIDPELNDPRPNALILVNRRELSALKGLGTEVYDGDEIVIIPVTHGG